jgi:hypothetical protein
MAISILYYDHLCTFSLEITRIWLRPLKNAGAGLFILNRYLNFFGDIAVTVALLTTMPEESCRAYATFRQWLLVAAQVIICGGQINHHKVLKENSCCFSCFDNSYVRIVQPVHKNSRLDARVVTHAA